MSIDSKFLPESKPVDEVGQILLQAAELIRQRGWMRGRCRGFRGEVCAGMALSMAAEGQENPSGFMFDRRAAEAERRLIGRPYAIQDWNDAPGRTADEVIRALEAAALLP